MNITDEILKDLHAKAVEVSKNAYVAYSHFPVGAAILLEDGRIITGANIENRSFGLTNCAERSAIFTAASQGYRSFCAIAIATPKADYPVGPCGACRQVISEFAKADTPVVFGPTWENSVKTTVEGVYPYDSLHELAN
ncbi:MAG: cytidine deaminase [Treponema sp.]|nr:cytidine deaminase [Treponema sp.]